MAIYWDMILLYSQWLLKSKTHTRPTSSVRYAVVIVTLIADEDTCPK